MGFVRGPIGVHSGFVDGSFGISSSTKFRFISRFPAWFRHFFFQAEEAVCGAMILPVETSFVAAHVVEVMRLLVEGPEGEHGLGWKVLATVGVGQAILFVREAGGFDGPGAEDAPARYGSNFRTAP